MPAIQQTFLHDASYFHFIAHNQNCLCHGHAYTYRRVAFSLGPAPGGTTTPPAPPTRGSGSWTSCMAKGCTPTYGFSATRGRPFFGFPIPSPRKITEKHEKLKNHIPKSRRSRKLAANHILSPNCYHFSSPKIGIRFFFFKNHGNHGQNIWPISPFVVFFRNCTRLCIYFRFFHHNLPR